MRIGRDVRYSARGGIHHWHSIGAYDAVPSHHARGACEVRGSAGNGFGLFDTMTTNFDGYCE